MSKCVALDLFLTFFFFFFLILLTYNFRNDDGLFDNIKIGWQLDQTALIES